MYDTYRGKIEVHVGGSRAGGQQRGKGLGGWGVKGEGGGRGDQFLVGEEGVALWNPARKSIKVLQSL
jgi:hypothetical protein